MTHLLHRWTDIATDTPIPGLLRQRVIGKQAMISHITLKPGCEVPHHAHQNEQFAVVLSGLIRFELGDKNADTVESVDVRSGEVLHLPANLPHSAVAIEETIVLDVFSPPSETTGIDRENA